MKSLGRIFRVGDRIIQTRNNEDVSNGEVGIISRIYTDDDGERLVDITLLDGREVTYNDELMENVDLSYCITVHKSQGGEFSTVIIPLLKEHYVMLLRICSIRQSPERRRKSSSSVRGKPSTWPFIRTMWIRGTLCLPTGSLSILTGQAMCEPVE